METMIARLQLVTVATQSIGGATSLCTVPTTPFH